MTATPAATSIRLDQQVWRLDHNIADAELADNLVLLSIDDGKYYNLNATSADLWRWLEQPIVVSELVTRLLAKYECESAQAQHDVLNFLNELQQMSLLSVK